MALTLQDLIDEIRVHLGGRSDVTDSRIVRALNLAQEYVARSHDYEELFDIATGQLTASDKFLEFSELPSSFQNPHEVYSFRLLPGDGRARKLIYRSTRSFDRLIPEPEFHATGLPSHYTIWSSKFELWRLPDAAYDYELRLSVWPTEFSVSNLAAKSVFKEKDDMLIMLATSWIYGQLGEYERMARFFNVYRARAESAEMEDDKQPDREIVSDQGKARPEAVIGRPWSDPFVRFIR